MTAVISTESLELPKSLLCSFIMKSIMIWTLIVLAYPSLNVYGAPTLTEIETEETKVGINEGSQQPHIRVRRGGRKYWWPFLTTSETIEVLKLAGIPLNPEPWCLPPGHPFKHRAREAIKLGYMAEYFGEPTPRPPAYAFVPEQRPTYQPSSYQQSKKV